MEAYNITGLLKGDTFDGVQFTFLKNDVAINLTTAVFKIDFRSFSKTGEIVKTITSAVNGGITITDAVNGVFRIDPFVVNFEVGVYYYDIQMTIGTAIKTYVGGTFQVLQDVTT